jgi:hypothetical protein
MIGPAVARVNATWPGVPTMATGDLIAGEIAFARPVMAAVGLAGEATAAGVLMRMSQAASRDRILAAENAIADVFPPWTPAAEQGITALCPGWTVRYDVRTGHWRARRINGSGYWAYDSPRACGVLAPCALWLLALIEQQALLDIAEDYPDWYCWPGNSAWCALPTDEPADSPPQLLSAATAAALAAIIGEAAEKHRFASDCLEGKAGRKTASSSERNQQVARPRDEGR